MTDPTTDDRPPGVRVLTDGGTETTEKHRTVTADAVVEREVRDDDEEREVLRVPISSTRQDRDGDAFSREDLEARAEQIRSEQPMVFDDHGAVSAGLFGGGYSARETIGTQFDAEVEEDGDDHATLYSYINPDGTHPEGERMLKQVRDEMQAVKFSVGFRILKSSEDMNEDARPDRADEIPGRLFMRTDLMETSRVGIPANPDASAGITAKAGDGGTDEARLALAAQLLGVDTETLADEGGMVAKADGGQTPDADTKGKCDVDADCPDDEVCVNGECVPEDSVEDDAGDTDSTKATCPECGESVPDDANYCPNCGAEMDGEGGDDDDDGGDEDEDSTAPEDTDSPDDAPVTRAEFDDLKSELKAAREALAEGRGDPETANTDTTENRTPTDDEGETTDADDGETERKDVPQTALERAGSN